MEERIYFKPEGNTRDKKIKRKESEENNKHKSLKVVGISSLLLLIVLVVFWLLRGKTTTTGQYPENIKNEYLDCASEGATYPVIGAIDSDKSDLRATMVFYGQQELSSISIKYTLLFSDIEKAHFAEPIVNTRFHEYISQIVDQYSAFNNKVTLLDDTIIVTLHASKNDLTGITKNLFMIKETDNPISLTDFKTNFEAQGFVCQSSIDNN